MNRNVKVFTLDVMKSIHVFLRRITTFLAGQVKADYTPRAKIDCEFRHFERGVHIAHRANDQTERYPEIFARFFQSLQHRGDYLLMSQSLLGMKYGRKASLEINNPVFAQIL